MNGCEWDDETGEVTGFNQFAYDGEDFISLDLKTETWIAPTPQGVITKLKWDQDKPQLAYLKNFYIQECPIWVKRFLEQGRSSLLRTGDITEPPSTSCSSFLLCGIREQLQSLGVKDEVIPFWGSKVIGTFLLCEGDISVTPSRSPFTFDTNLVSRIDLIFEPGGQRSRSQWPHVTVNVTQ